MWTNGTSRPDHGPGFRNRLCGTCGAGWVGHERDGDDWCPWCEKAQARQVDDQRRLLLHPPWLRSDAGNPRYDDLSEADKAVWDRTRGQTRGASSVVMWAARLRRAVEAGWISEGEADKAMRRVTR